MTPENTAPLTERSTFKGATVSICDCGHFMVPEELHERLNVAVCPICKTSRKLRWVYPNAKAADEALPGTPVYDCEGQNARLSEIIDRWEQIRSAWASNEEVMAKMSAVIDELKERRGDYRTITVDSLPGVRDDDQRPAWVRLVDVTIAEVDTLMKRDHYQATTRAGRILHEMLYWLAGIDSQEELTKWQTAPKYTTAYPENQSDSVMISLNSISRRFDRDSFVQGWLCAKKEERHIAYEMERVRSYILTYCATIKPKRTEEYYPKRKRDLSALYLILHRATFVDDELVPYLITFEHWLMTEYDGRQCIIRVFTDAENYVSYTVPYFAFECKPLPVACCEAVKREYQLLKDGCRLFEPYYVQEWLHRAMNMWKRQAEFMGINVEDSQLEVEECQDKN